MTAPLLAVLAIAVGLPLFAWWLARWPYWSRLRPGAGPDPWRDLVGQHGLSAADTARIAEDVPRGRRLPDPRLRRAVVDWARQLLEQEQVRLPRNPRTRGVVVVLVVVWSPPRSACWSLSWPRARGSTSPGAPSLSGWSSASAACAAAARSAAPSS